MTRVVVGDIGGTNARLELVDMEPHPQGLRRQDYHSPAYEGLAPVLRDFLASVPGDPPTLACLAVAGPVQDNTMHLTNRGWVSRGEDLAAELGLGRVHFLNDLAAVGYGLEALTEADFHVLQAGRPVPQAPKAVIAAGTGLGQTYLTWNGRAYEVWSSEGGHGDFAPRNALEMDLLCYWLERLPRLSIERFVSGSGLVRLYEFLAHRHPQQVSPQVSVAILTEEPAAVITREALAGTDVLCGQALDLFISLYGAEAGNLALKLLPLGGLYVAGGIAPRILSHLQTGLFLEQFARKGRMQSLLEQIPVTVITNPDVGLLGARVAAGRLLT
ncbi:MAG: glucokinase [Gloeomargaritaceae cyanobacterium C42_A2020_066]|nr:glucokinase [Gloeomargaritaceae cyanobacterium C42_A2020_066]